MIIISCPRGYVTGGTELLHQLCYKLNLFGFDARIRYYGKDDGKPATHPYFRVYNVPVAEEVTDCPETVLVYPEMMALSILEIKKQFPLSKHVLWWLSVDNAQMTPEAEKQLARDNTVIHLAQSEYAMDYARKVLSVSDDRLFYLSDYINYNFLNMDNTGKRDDIVLFNPRKGFERTAGIIKSSDFMRIRWRELAGISPEDMPYVLQSAKVYIDFGNHPGKDRFPREAVSCGCRLITGRKGSAANSKDVPIPEEFKINDDADDGVILEKIYSLIDDYDRTGELFADYLATIHEEFHEFEEDVIKTFSQITGKEIAGSDASAVELKSDIINHVTKEDYRNALYGITVYRISGLEIDDDMRILEGYTRLGLGEDQVALYIMNMLLANAPSNYEAHLINARALINLNKPGAEDELELAIKYSERTDDEEYIRETVKFISGTIS